MSAGMAMLTDFAGNMVARFRQPDNRSHPPDQPNNEHNHDNGSDQSQAEHFISPVKTKYSIFICFHRLTCKCVAIPLSTPQSAGQIDADRLPRAPTAMMAVTRSAGAALETPTESKRALTVRSQVTKYRRRQIAYPGFSAPSEPVRNSLRSSYPCRAA